VAQRIQFKIGTLTFDCTGPADFSNIACLTSDDSGHPGLRSDERSDLFVPRTRTTRLLTSEGGASSSQLHLSAASPSLPVHQSQSVSSRAQDWSFRLAFRSLFLWKLLKGMNWTELSCSVSAYLILSRFGHSTSMRLTVAGREQD